jgi:hypothetical protein
VIRLLSSGLTPLASDSAFLLQRKDLDRIHLDRFLHLDLSFPSIGSIPTSRIRICSQIIEC